LSQPSPAKAPDGRELIGWSSVDEEASSAVALVVAAEEGVNLIGGPDAFDPASLTGETPAEVEAQIPPDWVRTPSKSGGGEVFSDPANPGRQIRIMPGYGPGIRPDPLTAGPYAVGSQNGVVTKVPLAGNPTLP
jgi:hypothetical protein